MSRELIDAISNSNNVESETVFKDVMVQMVGNALEGKRKELAKAYVRTPVGSAEEDDG